MKSFLGLLFCVFVAAQLVSINDLLNSLRNRFGTGEGDTVDSVHGWRLEYHYGGDDHILLFINNNRINGTRYCYVVPVDPSWEPLMKNRTTVELITEEIYHLIQNPNHQEHQLRPSDLSTDYHHFDAARECRNHRTYDVSYTPSFAH